MRFIKINDVLRSFSSSALDVSLTFIVKRITCEGPSEVGIFKVPRGLVGWGGGAFVVLWQGCLVIGKPTRYL
jgi:hypothetical protein